MSIYLKATFQFMFSMRGQPATGKVQRNNYNHGSYGPSLTLFDIGGRGGMMAPQNVFDHCAQTLMRRNLKLGDF